MKMALEQKTATPFPVTRQDGTALDRLVRVVNQRKNQPYSGDFNEFELELGRRLREIGQEILRDELARADVDADAVLIDGVAHRRVLRGTETYLTTQGPVTVERTLYKDHSDPSERAVAVLEKRLGVMGGLWLPNAAKQATWVVAQMTPGLAEELFERVGTMQPSKSTLDRLPKELSGRWEDERKAFEAELREATVIPEGTHSIAVSIDGVLAPMKDGDAVGVRARAANEGRTSQGPAGYREIGCATISFCDEDGEMISAIRMARMPEHKKRSLKASVLAEVRSIWERRPDLRVVKVADAALDNWDFLGKAIPVGDEVIDFWHAAEHLAQAIAAVYGDGTLETRHRFAELRDTLLEVEDGVERVIRALDYQKKRNPKNKVVASALAYFRRHRKRMRYAAMREQGLPVGSGPVEAACKTLVAQRMKQSGMRWGRDGGQAILTTRGWCQSDRFDKAWALVAATYHVQVTTLDNVIPLRPARKYR
jgi:hypothetical protein